MPDLPRFEGRQGAEAAHAQGLWTAHGWKRRGRQVRPGAQPRALYRPGAWDDEMYPLYSAADLVPVERRDVAAGE